MGLEELKRLTLIPLIAFSLSVLVWKLGTSQDQEALEVPIDQQVVSRSEPVSGERSRVRRQRPLLQARGDSPGNGSGTSLSAKPSLTEPEQAGTESLGSPLTTSLASNGFSSLASSESSRVPDNEASGGRFVDRDIVLESEFTQLATERLPEVSKSNSAGGALREPPVLQDPRRNGQPSLGRTTIPSYVVSATNAAAERSFPRNLPSWIQESIRPVNTAQASTSNVDVQSLFQELSQYGDDAIVLTPEYVERWQARLQEAKTLARKGALFSAEQRVESLLLDLASTLDGLHECAVHQVLVNAGLTALHESSDFYSHEIHGTDLDWVRMIAASHKTQLNVVQDAHRPTAVQALQVYYDFGVQMLVWGCGHQAIAAEAMFVLGRIHQLSGQVGIQELGHFNSTAAVPVEVVYHQVAISLDPRHSASANELGVLLGQLGDWESAREVLLQSVVAHPTMESWKNLAEVHRRLGEEQLANLAINEARLIQSEPQNVVRADPRGVSEKSAATAQQQPRIWANR